MSETPKNRSRHADPRRAEAINALLDALPEGAENLDLIAQMLDAVASLPDGAFDRLEHKIMASTFADFRRAFEAFGDYRERPKVAVFGSARTPPDSPLYEHARRFSELLVEHGFMAITGAGPGIMQAGNQGAGKANSFGVNINLPFEQSSNPYIADDPKLVNFKYFFTRKLSFVKECHAVALFPGGMGTQDEGFETLTLIQTGKREPLPVVLIDIPGGDYWIDWEQFLRDVLLRRGLISADDFNLFRYTSDVEKAVEEIELFYRNYHSLRYIGNEVVLRLKTEPTEALLAELNERYQILLAEGEFARMDEPHAAERSEPEAIRALPRIGFKFVQRRFGTLRRLIDTINLTDL